MKEHLKNIDFPKSIDINLTVSADMIERRLLASDWSLPTRLILFSRSFGINLQKDDVKMVQQLGTLRGKVLHTGNHDIILTTTKMRALEYLIERLIMAASVCAYKKLEDNQRHRLQWLPLGREGGAAPLKLDGKLVSYDFFATNLGTDNEKQEWSINGYIYDKDNSQVTK